MNKTASTIYTYHGQNLHMVRRRKNANSDNLFLTICVSGTIKTDINAKIPAVPEFTDTARKSPSVLKCVFSFIISAVYLNTGVNRVISIITIERKGLSFNRLTNISVFRLTPSYYSGYIINILSTLLHILHRKPFKFHTVLCQLLLDGVCFDGKRGKVYLFRVAFYLGDHRCFI